MINLRPYQTEAIRVATSAMLNTKGNPCIVLPTGAGKSIVLAKICEDYIKKWPKIRIIILAHVKELVRQNAEKLELVWEDHCPIGICCASLDKKEFDKQITFASIQTIYNKADKIGDKHLIIVDEAHHINLESEGMYRKFIDDMKKRCVCKVLGLTATPYRTKGGLIVGDNYILNSICYEAKIKDLINQGYLTNLISKRIESEIDFNNIAIKQGEFDIEYMGKLMSDNKVLQKAIKQILELTQNKNHILVFCSNIEHAEITCNALNSVSITSEVVHSLISKEERDEIIKKFNNKELRCLVNVNILTEGFDVPFIDCIVLLRATMSPGLYYQMVGRGFRIAECKQNCLILDYGKNIERHGCIDDIKTNPVKITKGGEAPVKSCPNCFSFCHLASRECKDCGYIFPVKENSHFGTASFKDILSNKEIPVWVSVRKVEYKVHEKNDKKMLRVIYYTDFSWYNEFICLEHEGFAKKKAQYWWEERSNQISPITADEALERINELKEPIKIKVEPNGKFWNIIGYEFYEQQEMFEDEIPY